MRLIDADAITTKTFVDFVGNQDYISFGDALWMISELPTVEAKSVVVGEWKYDWLGEYICSNCHERVVVKEVMGEPAWDWCPACGAYMRGGKND